MYEFESFYKTHGYNPNYDDDVVEYLAEVQFMADLIYELTRLLNLILDRVREIDMTYKADVLLYVGLSDCPNFEYRDSEKSDLPYPGLRQFAESVGSTREYYITAFPILRYLEKRIKLEY